MPVHGFDHLNIRTPAFKQTVEFLTDALGMSVSPVPGLASTEKAAWILDCSGTAVLHLASADVPYSKDELLPDPPPRGSGAIHHVALSCSDIEAMRARLRALNLQFRENILEQGASQIFVTDPSGITFELNFRDGWQTRPAVGGGARAGAR